MAWINSRTRSRRPASIGSNQLSKRSTAVSVWGCERSGCVLMIVMAWSPVRRFNAGRFEVEHPGDYATFNSYQPRYGTLAHINTVYANGRNLTLKIDSADAVGVSNFYAVGTNDQLLT